MKRYKTSELIAVIEEDHTAVFTAPDTELYPPHRCHGIRPVGTGKYCVSFEYGYAGAWMKEDGIPLRDDWVRTDWVRTEEEHRAQARAETAGLITSEIEIPKQGKGT